MTDDYIFQPIPRTCPIDRGSVALIGGVVAAAPSYILWKDRQEIVIQVHSNVHLLQRDPDDPWAQWHWISQAVKLYTEYLEIIQLLLSQIPFGETNRVFLLKNGKTQQYYLRSKPMVFSKISCPLWAALIPEDDIEFTVWSLGSDRRGIWKGKEVDIIYAYEPSEMVWLNQSMYGYRAVSRLDLTFEVYGHLIGKDGSVIGLVSEAAWGRMVKPSDARLVYDAVAQVQGIGCLYRGCLTNRFMIAGNKVRLIDLSSISYYKNRELLEELAESWHWDELEKLFQELETQGPYGNYRIPPPRFTTTHKDLDIIPPLPRLRYDLPIGGIVFYRGWFKNHGVEPWEGYVVVDGEDEGPSSSIVIRRRGTGVRTTRRLILRADGYDVEGDTDLQQANMAVPRRQSRLLLTSPRHPYHHQLTDARLRILNRENDNISKFSSSDGTEISMDIGVTLTSNRDI